MKGDHIQRDRARKHSGDQEADRQQDRTRDGFFRRRATLFDEQPAFYRDCRRQRMDTGRHGN